jgi:hypothetical protein
MRRPYEGSEVVGAEVVGASFKPAAINAALNCRYLVI